MKYRHRRNLTRTMQTVKTITKLNEGPWRWHLGIQAGIATGMSMALFVFAGYPFFGTIASLGALSVLYGTKRMAGERLVIMFLVGTSLVIVSLLVILCSEYEWLLFVYLLVVAATTRTQIGHLFYQASVLNSTPKSGSSNPRLPLYLLRFQQHRRVSRQYKQVITEPVDIFNNYRFKFIALHFQSHTATLRTAAHTAGDMNM